MAENDLNEILEKIASNPQIIEKLNAISESTAKENPQEGLSKIMEAISPLISKISSDKTDEKTDTPPAKSSMQSISIPIEKLSEKIAKNSKLLVALKPYLSHERCEIIDTVVKLSQVGDLMKLMK